jgi:hypothetical protein
VPSQVPNLNHITVLSAPVKTRISDTEFRSTDRAPIAKLLDLFVSGDFPLLKLSRALLGPEKDE